MLNTDEDSMLIEEVSKLQQLIVKFVGHDVSELEGTAAKLRLHGQQIRHQAQAIREVQKVSQYLDFRGCVDLVQVLVEEGDRVLVTMCLGAFAH